MPFDKLASLICHLKKRIKLKLLQLVILVCNLSLLQCIVNVVTVHGSTW